MSKNRLMRQLRISRRRPVPRKMKQAVLVLAGAALGIAGTLVFGDISLTHEIPDVATTPTSPPSENAMHDWAAVGPGRVEAKAGEAKISSQIAANVMKLLVIAGDAVDKDEIVALLDDTEQLARLRSARAEVEFRQAERDNAVTGSLQSDRRTAEEAVAAATDAAHAAQAELDAARQAARLKPDVSAVAAKHAAVSAADRRLAETTAALQSIAAKGTAPPPSRTESALALARADFAAAQASWQKTILRAPFAGRVLRTYKLAGEIAAPSPEDPVITLGDLSGLRVRAELEERNVGKVVIGQAVLVRSDALPDHSFKGRVSYVGLAATPKRIGTRQSGSQQAENVIEALVELEGGAPLLPGMRIDAFFEQTSVASTSGDSNGTN
jgi:HlyD family secretion protein